LALEFLVSSLLFVLQGLLLLVLLLLLALLWKKKAPVSKKAPDLLHSLSLKFGQQQSASTTTTSRSCQCACPIVVIMVGFFVSLKAVMTNY
jgi:hypothetical protein